MTKREANLPQGVDLKLERAALKAVTRDAILTAAARILGQEGPAVLTVRRIAQEVNASTKVIYTAFGGKDGLLDALYLRSFEGLEKALSSGLAHPQGLPRVLAMARAYRDYALAESSFYDVMFGDFGRSWQPPLASREQAKETFRILREALRTVIPDDDEAKAIQATRLLWATMHGVVSLHSRNLLAGAEGIDGLFDAAVHAVLADSGIDTGRTRADHAADS